MMRRISGYIIKAALLLNLITAAAQPDTSFGSDTLHSDPPDEPLREQTVPITEPGFRIGINISRPLIQIIEPSRFSVETVFDYNIGQELFAVAEAGYALRDLDEPTYHLQESGLFFRLGTDRSLYNYSNDVIAIGARLGFSAYDRSAPFVYVEQDYWGEYSGYLSEESFFRQWAEVVLVLKTEIFNNIFLGWNLRGKVLLFDKKDRHMEERYIPGFGVGTTNSTLGFDFYIYYRIPVRR